LFLIPLIKSELEKLPFSVPITWSAEVSNDSWADMEKYDGTFKTGAL
jgi:hypothetical protein